MTPEERNRALKNIGSLVPNVVFERFIMVLTQVSENNNNKLVEALNRICIDESDGFWYNMDTGEKEETITPIREIIDLLEGWMVTATVIVKNNRVQWHVQSLIGKVEY